MTAEQMWDSLATLIHTAPDLPNVPQREEKDRFLTNARKLGDALENLTPAELLERADRTSEIFKTNAVEFKDIVVPGYEPHDFSAEKAAQTQLFLDEAARLGIPPGLHAGYVKHRDAMLRLWPSSAAGPPARKKPDGPPLQSTHPKTSFTR